jgi:hypothetical protein
LENAGLGASDVDLFVHVTSTLDTVAWQDHFRYLLNELGLCHDVDLVHHKISAVPAWHRPFEPLPRRSPGKDTALVVASNCPSGYFGPKSTTTTASIQAAWGWLAPSCSPTAPGAVVLSSASKEHDDPTKGFLSVIGIHGLHRMEDGRTVRVVVVN